MSNENREEDFFENEEIKNREEIPEKKGRRINFHIIILAVIVLLARAAPAARITMIIVTYLMVPT